MHKQLVYRLVIIALASLLSACTEIKLSEHQTPQSVQELPYKYYVSVGQVRQATDGGFVTVVSRTVSNRGVGDYASPYLIRYEVVLIKTDAAGQLQWIKPVWSNSKHGSSRPVIHPLADGNYLVFLTYPTDEIINSTSPEYALIQVSSTGDVIAQLPTGGNKMPSFFETVGVVSVPGNGFYVKGQMPDNSSKIIPYILRFDEQGRILWRQGYTEAGVVGGTYGLAATADGGLILSRYGTNSGSSTSGILGKINATGQMTWLKRYTDIGAELVTELSDKGYLLLGKAPSSSNAMTLFRLDSTGVLQLSKQYTAPAGGTLTPRGIYATANAYVLVHLSASSGIALLTTDEVGNEQNRLSIGVAGDYAYNGDYTHLADGSFVFAIWNAGTVSLIKTQADKTVQWRSIVASLK